MVLKYSESVLIIEDEEDIIEILTHKLQKYSCNVLSSRSVKEAMQKLNNQTFALILLDLGLTDGSGVDVIKHIRRLDPRKTNLQTPVIVTSGLIDKNVMEVIIKDINGALIKPYGDEDFHSKVGRFLKKEEKAKA